MKPDKILKDGANLMTRTKSVSDASGFLASHNLSHIW